MEPSSPAGSTPWSRPSTRQHDDPRARDRLRRGRGRARGRLSLDRVPDRASAHAWCEPDAHADEADRARAGARSERERDDRVRDTRRRIRSRRRRVRAPPVGGPAPRVALLSQGSNLADPVWSPDGQTIAVTSYTLGEPRLLLVAADGRVSNPVKLSAGGEPYRPSYSPDGSWLVYTLRHEGKNDLHAVQVRGARDVALTNDGKSWNGVFSPDGKQMAFLRERDGVIDLYVMDLAEALSGGSPKTAVRLTHGEGIDGSSRPAWGA